MIPDIRFLRQQDMVDMDRLANLNITLIGAGSIGSCTALHLAKIGVQHLQIFDPDIIEPHNWSNQMFRQSDIGKPKAEAVAQVIELFGGTRPDPRIETYVDQPLTEVVISGVDSMKSRQEIWRSVRLKPEVQLYLDARMGLETLAVYAVHPQSREERQVYAKTLHSDENSLQEPCTARTICYTPLMAASILCSLVKRYVNGEPIPSSIILDLVTMSLMA